jgi:hypothetical protein
VHASGLRSSHRLGKHEDVVLYHNGYRRDDGGV